MHLSQYDRDDPGKRTHRHEEERLLNKSTGRVFAIAIAAWLFDVPIWERAVWQFGLWKSIVLLAALLWATKPFVQGLEHRYMIFKYGDNDA